MEGLLSTGPTPSSLYIKTVWSKDIESLVFNTISIFVIQFHTPLQPRNCIEIQFTARPAVLNTEVYAVLIFGKKVQDQTLHPKGHMSDFSLKIYECSQMWNLPERVIHFLVGPVGNI